MDAYVLYTYDMLLRLKLLLIQTDSITILTTVFSKPPSDANLLELGLWCPMNYTPDDGS